MSQNTFSFSSLGISQNHVIRS